jgi:DNA-binding IclR family transcriptional regulator
MNDLSDKFDATKGNAIAKVCRLLKALTEHSPQRLNELAVGTGLNRVTAFRILEELCAAGMLTKSGVPPRYDLGPEVVAMAAASARSLKFTELARPSMLRLADMSGDTVTLHMRSNAESLCADKIVGDFPIRANLLHVGSRRPLGVGAGSMALLAWLPREEQAALLEITCRRISNFPNFNRNRIEHYIAKSQRTGHVTMCDIIVDKMGAIAAPIRSHDGAIRAALSIAALTERIHQRERKLADALQTECKSIAEALLH